MNYEKAIELTFKIIVILASLGVVGALIKGTYGKIKKALFYFSELEQRVQKLERKRKYKPKTKKK